MTSKFVGERECVKTEKKTTTDDGEGSESSEDENPGLEETEVSEAQRKVAEAAGLGDQVLAPPLDDHGLSKTCEQSSLI